MSNEKDMSPVLTENKFTEFYNNHIYPYLNGAAHTGFTPVGTIEDYLGLAAPQNYLKCDGSVVNIADYPDLADFIEDRFGSKNYYGGNGTTTFGLPTASSDITGAIKIIAYKNIYIDAVIGGENTVITNPQEGQGLVYDATNGVWKNGAGGMHEYSTTEKVIGKWIDGKNLYEKVLEFGALPNTTSKDVNLNISNLEAIYCLDAIAIRKSSGSSGLSIIPIPHANPTGIQYQMMIYVENAVVTIVTGNNMSDHNGFVILKYTKTTDQAQS